MIRGFRFAVVVTIAVLVAGCASDGTIDGPVLTSGRPAMFGPSGGMAAIVTGTLAYDEESACLHLVQQDVAYAVVWPFGAAWQSDPPSVVLNGNVIKPGRTVTGDGGYIDAAYVEEMVSAEVADAAGRCAGPTGEIAFFNIGSAVEVS